MKPSARRARHLLRLSRRNAVRMEPVESNGTVLYYRMGRHPDYVRRYGFWSKGTSWKTKVGQNWLKDIRRAARWDAYHATSDCCGWGNGEVYHGPYRYTGTDLVPRRNRMRGYTEKE